MPSRGSRSQPGSHPGSQRGSEPRSEVGAGAGSDPAAPGTLLLYLWGSLAAFGAFLVGVPGREAAARAWLWIGLLLLGAGVAGLYLNLRTRLRHLRGRAR